MTRQAGSVIPQRRARGRALLAMGLIYMTLMVSMDAIARSGVAEGIPILGWGTQGPFTLSWFAGSLIKHSIATGIFVFIMSRVLPSLDREAGPASARPRSR